MNDTIFKILLISVLLIGVYIYYKNNKKHTLMMNNLYNKKNKITHNDDQVTNISTLSSNMSSSIITSMSSLSLEKNNDISDMKSDISGISDMSSILSSDINSDMSSDINSDMSSDISSDMSSDFSNE